MEELPQSAGGRIPDSKLSEREQRRIIDAFFVNLPSDEREKYKGPETFIERAVLELFDAEQHEGESEEYRAILRVADGYIYTAGNVKIYQSLTELCKNELKDDALLERLRRRLWVVLSPVTRSSQEAVGPKSHKGQRDPARDEELEAARVLPMEIEARIREDGLDYALTDDELTKGTARFPSKELDEIALQDVGHAAELEILRRHVNRNLPPPTRKEIRASKYLGGLEDILNPYDRGIEERPEAEPFTIPGSRIFDVKEQHKLFVSVVTYLAEKGLAANNAAPEQLIEYVVLEWAAKKDAYNILRPTSPYLAIWRMKNGYALINGARPKSLVTFYPTMDILVKNGLSGNEKKRFIDTLNETPQADLMGWVGGGAKHDAYRDDIKNLTNLLSRA